MEPPPNFPPDDMPLWYLGVLLVVFTCLAPWVANVQRDIWREAQRNKPYQVPSAYAPLCMEAK